MTPFHKQPHIFNAFCSTITILIAVVGFCSCHAQSSRDTANTGDTALKVAPESLSFTVHIVENNSDGSKAEIDTITGYRKYYYSTGKVQMEGKVTKGSPKDYRDGIWKYYNEAGQLMKQETYIKDGKVNELGFLYFINGKPLSRTYLYYEGDYKVRSTVKFHKIETMFYTNGQKLAERHWVNNSLIDERCWDNRGNSKPIEYLETVKSLQVEQ